MLEELYIVLTVFSLTLCFQRSSQFTNLDETCKPDFLHNSSVCYRNCPNGSFSLPGMTSCHPWLNCGTDIVIISLISASVVKTVYLADWEGFNVVLSVLSSDIYEEDFLHNLYMLKLLSMHEHTVKLLGFCENSILTEYHELGDALNTHYHLNSTLKAHDNLRTRLNLCISYVSVIEFIHNTSAGVLVMCDSNTLEKTLSQYLLTVDLQLVVNDLDATPMVDISKGGVRCGNRELTGKFVAPEQVWPYHGIEFDNDKMPLYDEKTDIFKIPDVCNWFLGNSSDADVVKYKLFEVHKSCKGVDPNERPGADFIVDVYKKVLDDIT